MNPSTQPSLIRVLIADDSPLAVEIIKRMLGTAGDIVVVGVASNGEEALRLIVRLRPDVICTDLHMPKMSGLELTRQVLVQFPIPILVLSVSVQADQTGNIFELLEAGAVDVFAKPVGGADADFLSSAPDLVRKVRILAGVKVMRRAAPAAPGPQLSSARVGRGAGAAPALVAVGSSTGGPQALAQILGALPANYPVPVLCVQHIATGFMTSLVDWLASHCKLKVRLAREGDVPQAGTVYFAPDHLNVELDLSGRVRLAAPPGSGPRPSVDAAFLSVARHHGSRALGVLLTGMGSDGALGMRAIADAGGATIAQDEDSCVVYGMPREAVALGAVGLVLPLERIADALVAAVYARDPGGT